MKNPGYFGSILASPYSGARSFPQSSASHSSRASYRFIFAAFWTIAALSVVLILSSLVTFHYVVRNKDEAVATLSDDVLQLERLNILAEQKSARAGAYLLTHKTETFKSLEDLKKAFKAQLGRLRKQVDPPGNQLLDEIESAEISYQSALSGLTRFISRDIQTEGASLLWKKRILPAREKMERAFARAIAYEQMKLAGGLKLAREAEAHGTYFLIAGAVLTLLLSVLFGTL